MATIIGMTAASMAAIRNAVITAASISGDNLILTKYDGSTFNAGNVRGPQGANSLITTELGNAINLNTLTAPANYTQTSDSEAAAGTNYPVPYGGQLQVVSDAVSSPTIVFQEYRVIGSSMYAGLVYSRQYASSAWSSWVVTGGEGPWQAFPFNTTDWANYNAAGGTYQICQFRLSGNGVRLRGLAKTLNALSATSTVGTLPTGARPSAQEAFPVMANPVQTTGAASTGTAHTHNTTMSTTRVEITTAGLVTTSLSSVLTLASGSYISLSEIRFDLS